VRQRGRKLGYHRRMRPFKIPKSKKTFKTAHAIDVAARYFVYKLYEVTDGRPMAWKLLSEMGESRETALRAVERGWVTIKGVGGKPLDRSVVLTDEGRRLARRAMVAHSARTALHPRLPQPPW
jgi:hypothetical protein